MGLSRHVGDVGSAQPRTTAHRDPKEVTPVVVSTHSWHINGTFTVTPVDQPVWHPDGGPPFDADSATGAAVWLTALTWRTAPHAARWRSDRSQAAQPCGASRSARCCSASPP